MRSTRNLSRSPSQRHRRCRFCFFEPVGRRVRGVADSEFHVVPTALVWPERFFLIFFEPVGRRVGGVADSEFHVLPTALVWPPALRTRYLDALYLHVSEDKGVCVPCVCVCVCVCVYVCACVCVCVCVFPLSFLSRSLAFLSISSLCRLSLSHSKFRPSKQGTQVPKPKP